MAYVANRNNRSFYNKGKFSLVRNNSIEKTYINERIFNAPNGSKNISTATPITRSQNQNGEHQQSTPLVKQFGAGSAVSLAKPCLGELHRTEELCSFLESHNIFESENELYHRMTVLIKLNTLVKKWIKAVAISKNMPIMAAGKLGGKIFTFGSFRLGVHQKGADIDALCVAPRNIERADFFKSFFQILKEQTEVTECRAIKEAFVPVIKMNFDGIEIDLLFARLAFKEIPNDLDLMDNNILKNLDPYSVRSLNGVRVTEQILDVVPNMESFCLALRTIKLWAKKNGIYSNTLGYFGGVTWAMLVAKTCQFYPNATAATLVNKFFLVFSRWKWPNPVLLKHRDYANLNFPVWDPSVNVSDRSHLMPIITPAYPQQNSTYNVSESTKKILVDEIKRGLIMTNEVMAGLVPWERLIEAPNFFYRYHYYLVLMVHSPSAEDHVNWCGFVESKLRFLITSLEQNPDISQIHANPKCFECKGTNIIAFTTASYNMNPLLTESPYSSMWFIGLDIKRNRGNLDVDLTEDVDNFYEIVKQQKMKAKMFEDDMNIGVRFVEHKHLSQYLDAVFAKPELKSKNLHPTVNNRKRLAKEMIDSQQQPERPGGVKVRRLNDWVCQVNSLNAAPTNIIQKYNF